MSSINVTIKARPVEEDFAAEYHKGNPGGTVPVSYTVSGTLKGGAASTLSLARRRMGQNGPLDPTLMSVGADELDGLIELLIATRDAMSDRGMKTRYAR